MRCGHAVRLALSVLLQSCMVPVTSMYPVVQIQAESHASMQPDTSFHELYDIKKQASSPRNTQDKISLAELNIACTSLVQSAFGQSLDLHPPTMYLFVQH